MRLAGARSRLSRQSSENFRVLISLQIGMRVALACFLPVLLAAQSSLLQIRVVGGDGTVYAAGSRTAGIAVEVTDELGRPVAGAVASFHLPEDGSGGAFANGLGSEIVTTGVNGRATTTPVRWNRIPGPVEIRITAVSGRLRAGTVLTCELSDTVRAKAGAGVPAAPSLARTGRLKWVLLGLAAAAGAAGAGFATGRAASSGSHSSGSDTRSEPVQIGSPVITIGKP